MVRYALLRFDRERGDELVGNTSVFGIHLDTRRQSLGHRDLERIIAVGNDVVAIILAVLVGNRVRVLVLVAPEQALETLLARGREDVVSRDGRRQFRSIAALSSAPRMTRSDADQFDKLGVGCSALARRARVWWRRNSLDLFELDAEPLCADGTAFRGRADLDGAGQVRLRAVDERKGKERVERGSWVRGSRCGDARVACKYSVKSRSRKSR